MPNSMPDLMPDGGPEGVHDGGPEGVRDGGPGWVPDQGMLVAPLVLRRPAHRVDPRARYVWGLTAVTTWLMLLIPLGLLAWLVSDAPAVLRGATVVLAAFGALFSLVMPQWRYRVHRWEVTDEAVYTLTGWISQTSRIAPISRVQTVDSHYGPLQRAFGLGTLKVTTASAHGAVEVAGLPRGQVEELVARLTAATSRDEGDAT